MSCVFWTCWIVALVAVRHLMNRIKLVHLSAGNTILHSPERLVLITGYTSSMPFLFESHLKNDGAKLFLSVPSEIRGNGHKLQPRRFRLDIWKK